MNPDKTEDPAVREIRERREERVVLGNTPRHPYRVVAGDPPCASCGRGATWNVMGPDGCLEGPQPRNTMTELQALDHAAALNAAFFAGRMRKP